jgi:glycosyltransferase involved in cell wall biosynthesis
MPDQNIDVSNHIIQSFWTGTLTTMERLCIKSFLANGHEFHLYTYDKLEDVPDGCVIKDASEIVPKSHLPRFKYVQQFADFFRYALLLKNGGWWVDMDNVCLKPWNFTEPYVFVSSTGDRTTGLNFAVIKVPHGCELIKQCYAVALGLEAHWDKMGFQEIGPELWAKKITELKLDRYIQPIDKFDPIHWDRIIWSVDPTKAWDLKDSYGLHLFHAAWNKGSQSAALKRALTSYGPGRVIESPSTDDTFPAGCLYEQLKRRYMPKVSVVITTINRSAQLRKTFESFVSQTFTDYEVVVVDDGTDTETPALCAETWPFPIRYFRLDRIRVKGVRGCCTSANYGVRQALAKIVILQNAECKHVGNVLEQLASRVTPENVVLCRADHLNPDGTVNPAKTDYMNIVREHQALFFCGAIYKSWFEKLRGFDENYDSFYGADDIDFSDRLLYSGAKFEYLTSAYVQHQWHPIAGTDDAVANAELLKSQKAAHVYLVQMTADMKAGKASPVRNVGKSWGRIVDVSIVITTFNRPELLRNTLSSINRQGYKNLEIIVVDDGTDAETQKICIDHGAAYIRLNRPQSSVYRCPSQPINVGIRRAKGSTIILQNAECRHDDPNAIKSLVDQVTDDNVVFARVMGLKADGTADWLYCGKESQRPFFFCGAMRRSRFEELRGMDEDYPGGGFDDNDFADRLKAVGVAIVYSDVKVSHQWHPHLGVVSQKLPGAMYEKKTADMRSGVISPVRNLNREWGALEPGSVVITDDAYTASTAVMMDFVPTPSPVMPDAAYLAATPFGQRIPGARSKYAKDGLTVDWWDSHRR